MRFFAGSSLAVAAVAAAVVSSAPIGTSSRLARRFDPALTQPQDALDGAIACPLQPNRSYKNVSKPVLFVPGDGLSGGEAYDNTYVQVVPGAVYPDAGFQPCYINPPANSLGDLQITAEYVVNAIKRLRDASGKPVPVTGFSDGNLALQWALTFYPSTRTNVDRFIAFAPPFKGANPAPGFGPLKAPAVWQRQPTSRFLKALKNGGGNKPLVPTTTIYSDNDENVPEPAGEAASSYLPGAANIRVQTRCDYKFSLTHFQQLWSQANFAIWQSALRAEDKVATDYSLGPGDCSNQVPYSLLPQYQLFVNFIPGQSHTHTVSGSFPPLGVLGEPALAPYAAKFA